MRRLLLAFFAGGLIAATCVHCMPAGAEASHACASTVEICTEWYEYVRARAVECGCTDCGSACISEEAPCPRYE